MLLNKPRSELDGLHSLDAQAVSAVYDHYFPEVFRYVRFRLGDEVIAEDYASDVFVRLLEAVRAGRGPRENLRGWLMGTASHLITDHLRRRYRRPVEPLLEDHASGAPAPAEEVESRDHARSVQGALEHLTPEQQHVLALRFGQGFSIEETAAVMKKNINAIKQLQLRALAALNRQMVKNV
jgi:RNA polymerase sigma-70 factor (ECF subfamily)